MASLVDPRGAVRVSAVSAEFRLKTHPSCCVLAAHTHRIWKPCPQTRQLCVRPVGLRGEDTAEFRCSLRTKGGGFLAFSLS